MEKIAGKNGTTKISQYNFNRRKTIANIRRGLEAFQVQNFEVHNFEVHNFQVHKN